MEWVALLSTLMGAAAGALVTAAPAIYRLFSGKAEKDRQDRLDLIASHERFEQSMQQRLDDYRRRIDRQQERLEGLERENGECKATVTALRRELDELRRGQGKTYSDPDVPK